MRQIAVDQPSMLRELQILAGTPGRAGTTNYVHNWQRRGAPGAPDTRGSIIFSVGSRLKCGTWQGDRRPSVPWAAVGSRSNNSGGQMIARWELTFSLGHFDVKNHQCSHWGAPSQHPNERHCTLQELLIKNGISLCIAPSARQRAKCAPSTNVSSVPCLIRPLVSFKRCLERKSCFTSDFQRLSGPTL